MDLNLGDSLGRFQIEARIGATGLASLYRARETTTGRRVALKVLRPYLSEASNAAGDYLSITARAAALSHPRVASIVDWGVEDVPWTAFALAEGSVADDSRPRTPREAARIVSDIAEALDTAHAAGLLHLDMKPGNVLIDDEGRFLLTDFGMLVVAAGVDPLVRVTSKTPLATFMSPEQADLGATTPASDIYSLGVLAYWLLTGGEAPYEGGDAATVAAKQLRYPAPSLEDVAPGVPRAVADVVARALSRNPESRFPTAGAFAQALTEAAEAAPDAPAEDSARRRSRREVTVNVPAPLRPPAPDEPFKAARIRWSGERWRSVATTKTQRAIAAGGIAAAIVIAILVQFALTGSSISPTPGVTSASSAEAWTMNQGDPLHTGILPGPGPALLGEVAWSISRIGRITHEPLVVDGVAYWSPGDRSFLALDAATGATLWEAAELGFVNVTPAYAEGRLYIATVEGLSVLDAATGTALWSRPLQGPNDSSPVVKDGVVYLGTGGGEVLALDAATGEEFWSFATGGVFSTGPALTEDGLLVASTRGGNVYLFNARNGDQRLDYRLSASSEGEAVIDGDRALIGSANGILVSIDLNERRRLFDSQTFWLQGQLFLFGFSDRPPTQRGFEDSVRLGRNETIAAAPVLGGGRIYINTLNGRAFALDAESLVTLWQRDIGQRSPGSPVLAGGRLYVATDRALLALDPATGDEVWRWDVTLRLADLAESPTLTAGGAFAVAFQLFPEIVITEAPEGWFYTYRASECVDENTPRQGPYGTQQEAQNLAAVRAPACSTLIALR